MSVTMVVLIMGAPVFWLLVSGFLFNFISPVDSEAKVRAEGFFARG